MEVLVAMTIFMTIMALSFMILANVNRNNNIPLKSELYLKMEEVFNTTLINKDYTENEIQYKGYIIRKKLEPYNDELSVLSVQVTKSKTTVYELKQLVYEVQ